MKSFVSLFSSSRGHFILICIEEVNIDLHRRSEYNLAKSSEPVWETKILTAAPSFSYKTKEEDLEIYICVLILTNHDGYNIN